MFRVCRNENHVSCCPTKTCFVFVKKTVFVLRVSRNIFHASCLPKNIVLHVGQKGFLMFHVCQRNCHENVFMFRVCRRHKFHAWKHVHVSCLDYVGTPGGHVGSRFRFLVIFWFGFTDVHPTRCLGGDVGAKKRCWTNAIIAFWNNLLTQICLIHVAVAVTFFLISGTPGPTAANR